MHSFFVILSTLSDSRQREVGILLVCELCQFKASHASNGTKCVIVIIVVAVAHLLCPLTSPTPSQCPFLPLQIVESSVNDTGKDFFLPLCSSKNTVVVSQWLLAQSHLLMLFFSSHVEQMTWLDKGYICVENTWHWQVNLPAGSALGGFPKIRIFQIWKCYFEK